MKYSLLKDIFAIVAAGVPGTVPETCKSLYGASSNRAGVTGNGPGTYVGRDVSKEKCQNVGGFYVLYDEAAESIDIAQQSKEEEEKKGKGRGKSNMQEWR
jgi:hypothetical protein